MKTHFSHSTKTLALSILLAAGTSSISAAVLPVTGFETTDFTFTSLTIGGEAYTDLIGSTATLVSPSTYYYPSGISSPPSGPGQADSVTSGLVYGEGAGNVNYGSLFQFGQVISVQDYIVVTDLANTSGNGSTPENLGFHLVDSSDAIVGTYSISIASAQYGSSFVPSTNYTVISNSSGSGVFSGSFVQFGVAFQLSDFTGTGDLSTATGIQFFAGDDNAWDPSVVALVNVVPEPSYAALLLAGAGLALLRRRLA